jgi:hypothetical protein
MFRIRLGLKKVVDVDTVDQISADPLPSGHTSRRWGVGIKSRDGSVVIERDPREA